MENKTLKDFYRFRERVLMLVHDTEMIEEFRSLTHLPEIQEQSTANGQLEMVTYGGPNPEVMTITTIAYAIANLKDHRFTEIVLGANVMYTNHEYLQLKAMKLDTNFRSI